MGSQKKKSTATKAVAKRRRRQIFNHVEFDGENFKLALIEKGNDISEEQKVDIVKVVCLMYSSDMYSLEECLRHCGIKSDSTFYKWLDEIVEIEELYLKAKAEKNRRYVHRIKHRARTKLEQAIEGYKIDLVETKSEAVPVLDKDGKVISYQRQVTEVKERQIYVRPSEKIILAVLYNTDSEVIQRNPNPPKEEEEIKIQGVDYSKLSTEELIKRAKAVQQIKSKEE